MGSTRLSGLDVAFLCMDDQLAPMNIGVLGVFAPKEPIGVDDLVALLTERAGRVPGLRRCVRSVWFPPGAAEWVDDPRFQAEAHVRVTRLPRPGNRAQMTDYVAQSLARPLDRARPLWELHVITGMADDQFGLLLKVHHAFADGVGMFMLTSMLADGLTPVPDAPTAPPEPGSLAGDMWHVLSRPDRWLNPAAAGVAGTVRQATRALGITAQVVRSLRLPPTPLVVTPSRAVPGRQLTTVRLDRAVVRQIRDHHGVTTNDVILTVLAGGLREWLDGRHAVTLRALIPVSLRGQNGHWGHGNELSAHLCELPVSEPDPVRRLKAVHAAMNRNKADGPYRGAGAIPLVADTVPAVGHRIASPLLSWTAGLLFDVVVTNVPLPDVELCVGGAPMREVYPIVPLAKGHALGVAIASYRGHVDIGLHTDPSILPDAAVLGRAIPLALAALVVPPATVPRPRAKPRATVPPPRAVPKRVTNGRVAAR